MSKSGRVALTRMDPVHPSELFVIDEDHGIQRRLTEFNDQLLSKLELRSPERFVFAPRRDRGGGLVLPPNQE